MAVIYTEARLVEILRDAQDDKSLKRAVISTGTQCSGEIYLEKDFSTTLHSARNDGNKEGIS